MCYSDVHQPGTRAIELRLSHVSRKWRAAALITPHLWSRQSIKSNSSPDRVQQYLVRSSLAPLELHLVFDQLSGRSRTFPSNLLSVCLAVERWESLSVNIKEFDIWGRFFGIFPKSAPSLQTLSVSLDAGFRLWGPLNPYDAFTDGAPLLRSVSMSNSSCTFYLPPLASVTHFTIGPNPSAMEIDLDSLRNAIKGFPCLLYLRIHLNIHNGDVAQHFALPSLQTLEIVDANALFPLLLKIDAPVLNHLILKDIEINTFNTIRSPLLAVRLNQFTFPSITRLSVETDCAIGGYLLQDWVKFASVLPAITHLELVETDYHSMHGDSARVKWKPFLDALAEDGGPADIAEKYPNHFEFWSNLTSISYQGPATAEMFTTLISTRAQRGFPIQLLRVSRDLQSQFANNDTWQSLRKLVQLEVFEPERTM